MVMMICIAIVQMTKMLWNSTFLFFFHFEWAILVISLSSAILDLEMKLHDGIFKVQSYYIRLMDKCQTSYSVPMKNLILVRLV